MNEDTMTAKIVIVTLFFLAIFEMITSYVTTGVVDFSKSDTIANGIGIILPLILGYFHDRAVKRALNTPAPNQCPCDKCNPKKKKYGSKPKK